MTTEHTTIDHAAEARKHLADVEAYVHDAHLFSFNDEEGRAIQALSYGGLSAQLAQVHATLALVEQQRIANLIALAGLPTLDGFENEVYDARLDALMGGVLDREEAPAVPGYGPAGIDEHVVIRDDIKKGLGL